MSNASDQLSLLAAIKPSSPTDILTVNEGADAVITWTPGSDNGSPITAYRILFKTSTNTYLEELTNCDGSNTDIVSS